MPSEFAASLLGGAEIIQPLDPIEKIGLVGERSTCDWDCYGLLESGYEKVQVQISGAEIDGPHGKARYFVSEPGVFEFHLATSDDPTCSSYMSWLLRMGLDVAEAVEGSLATNLVIARNGNVWSLSVCRDLTLR